jgi:uncharacterized lipoprotein YmbA
MNLSKVAMLLLFAAAAVGCRSTPVHYYTLLPRPLSSPSHRGTPQAKVKVTAIPASVDRLQLVVHQGNEISILDNYEWIAPLSGEIESALSLELVRRLSGDLGDGIADIYSGWSVRVNVLQLEAYPADRVFIAATWTANVEGSSPVKGVTCYSQLSESIRPGIDAVIDGYRAVISSVAGQIAESMRTSALSAGITGCPQS